MATEMNSSDENVQNKEVSNSMQPDDCETSATKIKITPEIVEALYADDNQEQMIAVQSLRRFLSQGQNCFKEVIDEVIQAGIVPKFVEFLHHDNSMLQIDAAWSLTNIAAGTSTQTKTLIEANAVPILIRLLDHVNEDIRELAVWALANIAADNDGNRDYVLEKGILTPLLQLLNKDTKLSNTKKFVWALSNLCRSESSPPKLEQISLCLPVLSRLLHNFDAQVLVDACWALTYISRVSIDGIQAVIDAGVCPRLVELLFHVKEKVVLAALSVIGEIVSGTNDQTQVVLDSHVLFNFELMLMAPTKILRKQVCRVISNIAAGNSFQIQAIIDAKLFPILIEIQRTAELQSRREATWAIANALIGSSPEQLEYLVELQSKYTKKKPSFKKIFETNQCK